MGTKISAQTAKTTLAGTEEVPLNDSTTAKKATLANIKNTYINTGHKIAVAPYYTDTSTYLSAPHCGTTSNITAAVLVNYIYLMPIVPPETRTFTSIAFAVTSGTTGNYRLGIYNATQSTRQPTTVIVDSGSVAVASTGLKTYSTSQSLTADTLYYLALMLDTANTVVCGYPVSTTGIYLTAAGAGQMGGLVRNNGSFGAFPDLSAITCVPNQGVGVAFPMIGIR